MIEGYQSGELEAQQAVEVRAHLRECEGCGAELALLESEAAICAAYAARTENALEAPPDLWDRALERSKAPAVKGVGAGKNRTRWLGALVPSAPWLRQALAASLLIAVSVVCTLFVVQSRRAKEVTEFQPAAAASGERSLEAALKSIQRAEQEYLNAIQVLTGVIEKQKSALDPRLIAELQENLKMIDQHIAATRRAYYDHPADAQLALYMLAAYSRKVELLQDLAS
jgi:hypothetical protein